MIEPNERQLVDVLKKLPEKKRIQFAISASERQVPLYMEFVRVNGWGDAAAMQSALTALRMIASGHEIPLHELAALLEQCKKAIPHTEDFPEALGSAAQSAGLAIYWALEYGVNATEEALSYVRNNAIDSATAASFLPESAVNEDEAEANEVAAQLRDATALIRSSPSGTNESDRL